MIIVGDVREKLLDLEDESVHCVVTSPPYWGLRDYGVDGQLGLEPTIDEYIANMVAVFREVLRVLRQDGTLWLNMGDGYSSKQLVGQPWRLAFALQADGWYLRSDIIWAKPNQMPESVTDRPTKSHEYIFLMSRSERYYYDADAIREPHATPEDRRESKSGSNGMMSRNAAPRPRSSRDEPASYWSDGGRNKRDVWTVATQPYPEAHFATFPEDLIRPCILAGCPVGGTVLDPFSGSGTTGKVAHGEGREYIGIELNPEYVEMSRKRIDALQMQLAL